MGLLRMTYTCNCTAGVAKVLNHYVVLTLLKFRSIVIGLVIFGFFTREAEWRLTGSENCGLC